MTPPALVSSPEEASYLLSQGKKFAAQGQSIRAEQYFLAAYERGVPQAEVFEWLIEVTIKSGRLRSALTYIKSELRSRPEEIALRQLATSIYWGLGLSEEAEQSAERLALSKALKPEVLLFLGEFYHYCARRSDLAVIYYRRFLGERTVGKGVVRVQGALNELEGQEPLSLLALGKKERKEQ